MRALSFPQSPLFCVLSFSLAFRFSSFLPLFYLSLEMLRQQKDPSLGLCCWHQKLINEFSVATPLPK